MVEEWKKHPKLNYVEVSTFGNVRTLDRVHKTVRGDRRYRGKLVKKYAQYTCKSKSMYEKCHLYVRGSVKNHWVHRLVAETFLENSNGFKYVDHIDSNGLNNHIGNLEWVTNATNVQRAIAKGDYKNITYYEGKSLGAISKELGSKYRALVGKRIKNGWCFDCAISTPSLGMGGNHRTKYCQH